MERVDNTYGSFDLFFKDGCSTWYLAIHPEMFSARQGVKPSGNYFIYCVHPHRGSCAFIIQQDENCMWFSKQRPRVISPALIDWIGRQIEILADDFSKMV